MAGPARHRGKYLAGGRPVSAGKAKHDAMLIHSTVSDKAAQSSSPLPRSLSLSLSLTDLLSELTPHSHTHCLNSLTYCLNSPTQPLSELAHSLSELTHSLTA